MPDDDLAHAELTAQFLQGEFGPNGADPMWSAASLRWKLGADNPAGRGYCTLAMHESRVVGAVTLAPRFLWVKGRQILGGEIGDTYTNHRFQRRGAAATLHPSDSSPNGYLNRFVFGRLATETRERAEHNGIHLIFGTPNRNALPGWTKRLGYHTPDVLSPERRSRPLPRSIALRAQRLAPAVPIIGAIDRLFGRFAAALAGVRISAYRIEDEEVDDLWLRARVQYGFSLVRDARWFRYRYMRNPIARYEFHAVRGRAKLEALLVTRIAQIAPGRQYAVLVDWLADPALRNASSRLAGALLPHLDRAALSGATGWFNASTTGRWRLVLAGYLSRGRQPVILAGDRALVETVASLSPQEFPIGTSDNA